MSEDANPKAQVEQGCDPSIPTANTGFDPAKLVICQSCGRKSPPHRHRCLYCGHESKFDRNDEATDAAVSQKPELWQSGINIILRSTAVGYDTKQAARIASLDPADLDSIAERGQPLPIARVENEREAIMVVNQLGLLGLDCFGVADDDLMLATPNIRISGIEFAQSDFGLRNFNTRELKRFRANDICLIVEGGISNTKVDVIEKRKFGGDSKLVDESSIANDGRIVDIYISSRKVGYRLFPTGFDFSCLGNQKGMLARENWGRLINLLKEQLPSARFASDYDKMRETLAPVWPVEVRSETRGVIRSGLGKRSFGSSITTSNLDQFNRYSRLQRHLV